MIDGNIEKILQVGRENEIEVIQNIPKVQLRGRLSDGAARIAQHYKFALTTGKTFHAIVCMC